MGWDAVDRFNSLAFMAYNEADLKSLLAMIYLATCIS